MIRIFKYLKEFRTESLFGPLFKFLAACFELAIPFVVAVMINKGILVQNKTMIIIMGVILIILGVLGLVSSLFSQLYASRAAVGAAARLREDLFAHISRLSHPEIDRIGTDALIERTTEDVDQVQKGIDLVLCQVLYSPVLVIGSLIMGFSVSGRAGIMFILVIPIVGLVFYTLMKKNIQMLKQIHVKHEHMAGSVQENLKGIREVRAFCQQKREIKEFKQETEDLKKMQMKESSIFAKISPITYAVINTGVAGILWIVSYQVNDGNLMQGNVFAISCYMLMILTGMMSLASLLQESRHALECEKKIEDIFALAPTVSETHQFMLPTVPGSPKIEFKNVSFTYAGSKEAALEGIDFKIYHGETIGVIGSTGSGKSTLISLIPRFYDATDGEIRVDGQNVKEYSFGQLRRKIGYVPQKAVLFKGTIRDNMKWGLPLASDRQICQALDVAQAKAFIDSKKEGLDFKILQGGRNLAGGMRQRLTIARALVKKPEILILDDSTSTFDNTSDANLRDALEYQTQGATTILVSQSVRTVRNADRIIVLKNGKIAGIGNHYDLIKNCEEYKEICLSQLSGEEVEA